MKRFFLPILATVPLLVLRQTDSPPCVAHLALNQQGELLHITGSCRSQLDQAAHYRYELQTIKHGPSGESRTTQGGRFDLPAQQQVQLSQVGLGAGADSHYRIHLLIFNENGQTVAQDSASR